MQMKGSPFAAGTKPLGVTADPQAKFLYVANAGSNNVRLSRSSATAA